MIYLIFLLAGFLVHLLRDYDRARPHTPGKEYLKKNSLKITGSFILSLCIFAIINLEDNINGITALTLGYAGDSFFRYLIDKNYPNARF
jgi:hypothetical protein